GCTAQLGARTNLVARPLAIEVAMLQLGVDTAIRARRAGRSEAALLRQAVYGIDTRFGVFERILRGLTALPVAEVALGLIQSAGRSGQCAAAVRRVALGGGWAGCQAFPVGRGAAGLQSAAVALHVGCKAGRVAARARARIAF